MIGTFTQVSGLIRLHVLHHAAAEPIFGLGMLEELGRHGYKISAGTLSVSGFQPSIASRVALSARSMWPLSRCVITKVRSTIRFALVARPNITVCSPDSKEKGPMRFVHHFDFGSFAGSK
jgi:hypothetical protein